MITGPVILIGTALAVWVALRIASAAKRRKEASDAEHWHAC